MIVLEMLKIQRKEAKSHMELRKNGELEYLVFPELEKIDFIKHLFSTRIGGVSKGHFSQANFSHTRGDDNNDVDENYRRVAQVLGHGRTLDDFVCTFQTHTTNVKVVTEEDRGKGTVRDREYTDVDGLITNVPGIILTTFHADCPAVYIVDPVNKAIGLVHSGWRGTYGRISAVALNKMNEQYGTKPEDTICCISPSICQDCYEVSDDVYNNFKDGFGNVVIPGKKEGKWQLDLWGAIKNTLTDAGVQYNNIIVTDICTCCNPQLLFSHRVQGENRGNLAAFMQIV